MIDLYVNTDAAGGGNGSIGAPWNHLSDAITALEVSGPEARGDAVTVHCSGTTADTDAGGVLVQFSIATTAARYLLIQGNNTLGRWNTAAYRLEVTDPGVGAIYNNVTSHLQIDRIQLKVTATSGTPIGIKTANANIIAADAWQRCTNCIVWGVQSGGTVTAFDQRPLDGTTGHGTAEMWNCLAIDCRFGFTNDFIDGSNFGTFANCTSVGHDFGFTNSAGDTTVVINCLASNPAGIGFIGPFQAASNYNASDDGNAIPGANSNSSATFTFVDAAADNFCLDPDDTGALGLGTAAPLGVEFDDDLQGVTRPAAWSIGALEEEREEAAGGGRMLLTGVG